MIWHKVINDMCLVAAKAFVEFPVTAINVVLIQVDEHYCFKTSKATPLNVTTPPVMFSDTADFISFIIRI